MDLIKKLFAKWFAKKANYAPQALNDKQKAIIEMLDAHLVSVCSSTTDNTVMALKSVNLGLFNQHYGVAFILAHLRKEIVAEGFAYIPRSIALITQPDGTWTFVFALRATAGTVDELVSTLYLDALTRTNAAR